MTKLCPRGKAAAKRKFKVYPSAYANAYASKICAGKIKDPSGVKRKDFRGSKAAGGIIEKLKKTDPDKKKRKEGVLPKLQEFKGRKPAAEGGRINKMTAEKRKPESPLKKIEKLAPEKRKDIIKSRMKTRPMNPLKRKPLPIRGSLRVEKMGGGLMEATQRLKRQGLRKGGGVCLRGMNRDAIGKNS